MKKMFAKDYRSYAHNACSKFIGTLALITFIYGIIIGGLSATTVLAFVTLIIAGPFEISFTRICKKVHKNENVVVNDLFSGFDLFGQSLGLYILRGIFIFLWSLLLIIPGIIKALSWSMAFFILEEKPELSIKEALDQSKEMMNGHKYELFCLCLSYIGWLLLSSLTFGILLFWVAPRMRQAKYTFYLNINGRLNN